MTFAPGDWVLVDKVLDDISVIQLTALCVACRAASSAWSPQTELCVTMYWHLSLNFDSRPLGMTSSAKHPSVPCMAFFNESQLRMLFWANNSFACCLQHPTMNSFWDRNFKHLESTHTCMKEEWCNTRCNNCKTLFGPVYAKKKHKSKTSFAGPLQRFSLSLEPTSWTKCFRIQSVELVSPPASPADSSTLPPLPDQLSDPTFFCGGKIEPESARNLNCCELVA